MLRINCRGEFNSSLFWVSHSLLGMIDGSIPIYAMTLLGNQYYEIMNGEYFYWLKSDRIVSCWIFAPLSKDMLVEVHDVKFAYKLWELFQIRFMSLVLLDLWS